MIQKLIQNIKQTNAPIVVGLDPTLAMVPPQIKARAFSEYGETLAGAAEAIWQFNLGIIDAVHDLIPAVKPQIAMYEQYGIEGLVVYKKTIEYCKQKGLVVIGDVKRGDIGSTSAAYAAAHLGSVTVGNTVCRVFDEDFATVNPYFGIDGMQPFLDTCAAEKKGIFVLVKTSNPSSGEFQDQLVETEEGKKPLYELVGAKVAHWGETCMGEQYSYVGAVVGATYPQIGIEMRRIMPKTFILVPGYGAQGGNAGLAGYFHEDGLGAIVNSSRGIIAAYQNAAYERFGANCYADAARQAVLAMQADISAALSAAGKRQPAE